MKPFGIHVVQVDGDVTAGAIVPAGVLDQYLWATDRIRAARSRAARALWRARAVLAKTRRDAAELVSIELQKAREQAVFDARQQAGEARVAAIGETVEWLLAERDLEAAIAARFEQRFRVVLADALRQYAAAAVPDEVISRHLAPHLDEFLAHGKLSLRVHADLVGAITSRFSSPARVSEALEIIVDDTLGQREAVLDTPFVQLRIDLDRHLDELLNQLAGSTVSNGHHHVQD
ncbi:hypothetical protein EOS_35555 [Caballeronia mineralivorans PML1(12)]|uniref:Type III secretion system protein n=1 Tax=Caballeronia mineralivorans PML1(12) TaxID=908627 RepID=A0A0J1CL91_9BURK|nr:hypothetical protein [Caballeronia mineralivorans]KLU21492.1 hypothetical protein EOS_35555 [Caballeronia mineralivorans PML1(12)]